MCAKQNLVAGDCFFCDNPAYTTVGIDYEGEGSYQNVGICEKHLRDCLDNDDIDMDTPSATYGGPDGSDFLLPPEVW